VVPKPPTNFVNIANFALQYTPGWFPIVVQDANGTTIKYVGDAAIVPTSAPLFIQANPRGTGVEWFAVVKQGMKAAITNYAGGTSGPFVPLGQSQPVPFNNIVTTLMTNMNGLFNGKLSFNQPIASWDTSNVINMSYLFDSGSRVGANAPGSEFNQPIGSWNTSKVTTMEAMFYDADLFNQPIGSWNTGAVTNMSYMFHDATAFNQNISAWNVGAVVPKPPTGFSTNSALTAQNGPVWFPIVQDANAVTVSYTGNAADVPTSAPLFIQANPRGTGVEWFAVVKQGMKAAIYNYAGGTNAPFIPPGQSQPVPFNNIVTTLMPDMSYMFANVYAFNSPIASWDTSKVTTMEAMFYNATAFNQPIGSWNTGAVTNMSYMFYDATAFNQNISAWDVGAVVPKPPTNFVNTNNSALTAQNGPVWFPIVVLDANGTTIKYVGDAAIVPTSAPLFIQANPRRTGVEWFAVVKQGMKAAITNYAGGTSGPFIPHGQSQPVPFNNIVTTLMTDMIGLFNGKLSFNQPIASWDTSNVINMSYLFDSGLREYAANAPGAEFNQPIGSWNTSKVTTMEAMFYNATAFNQPIGSWNTGAVTNMSYMFYDATAFNQNISAWDVGAVVPKPPPGFVNTNNSALTAQNGPVWGIYAYSSHTFTTAGVSGITGPTLSDVRTAYANVGATWASSYVNMTTQGIQEWTVPATGSYTIRAVGAGVPYSGDQTANGMNQFQTGMDATITTTLTRGEVIKILVGQIPNYALWGTGGAGGTFVVRGTQTPIIVAGGGGGRGFHSALESSNATTGTSGQGGGGIGGGGGSEGGGGGNANGGGGGGLTGNGSGYGGLAFTNGGIGGSVDTFGGFGGGGSPSDNRGGNGGGGGGGYSGGGGGGIDGDNWASGGGGGSYSITGDFTSATANNNANGFVTITAK
jgi:surface protein